jgi:hypothetical protein
MGCAPGIAGRVGEKDAHGIRQLAVGGDIEDEFGGWSFRIVGERGTFSNVVVLVDLALGTGIGL